VAKHVHAVQRCQVGPRFRFSPLRALLDNSAFGRAWTLFDHATIGVIQTVMAEDCRALENSLDIRARQLRACIRLRMYSFSVKLLKKFISGIHNCDNCFHMNILWWPVNYIDSSLNKRLGENNMMANVVKMLCYEQNKIVVLFEAVQHRAICTLLRSGRQACRAARRLSREHRPKGR
jgi:hypothetical protein